jgi:hypothetical protein
MQLQGEDQQFAVYPYKISCIYNHTVATYRVGGVQDVENLG